MMSYSNWSFYQFQLQTAMDSETYIHHTLNTSQSKEAHCFSKAQRFPKSVKPTTETIYALPNTTTKRATSFGFGCKTKLGKKSTSPSPAAYNLPSQFDKSNLRSTTTLHEGRERVTFGSFIRDTLKRNKDLPSPDHYHIHNPYSTIGGKMGGRIKTDPSFRLKDTPGPGSYHLNSIQLGNKGHYALSHLKNTTSPRYFSTYAMHLRKKKHPPHSYNIQDKQLGKHIVSIHPNAPMCSFTRAARPALADRTKQCTPGAKYRSFSQFGN